MTTDVHRADRRRPAQTRRRIAWRRVRSVVAHVAADRRLDPDALSAAVDARRPRSGRRTRSSPASSLIPSAVSLDGYFRGWNGLRVSFGTFFLNSFIISMLCVAGNLAACSLAAFAFARLEFKGRNFWFALMLGTLMLPYQVTLIPQYVLFRHLGWVNTFLPLVVPKFLAVDAFFIFLMVQFFRGIPRELDEAAHDGRLLALAHLLEDHAAAVAAGADHRGDLHLHLHLGRFLRRR